jgi:hypothetical protein
MGRHMSKKHQQKNDRKTWVSDKADLGVRLQSWTTSGHRVYWVIAPDERTSDSQAALPVDCSPRRTERVAALHDEERRRLSNKAIEFSKNSQWATHSILVGGNSYESPSGSVRAVRLHAELLQLDGVPRGRRELSGSGHYVQYLPLVPIQA